MSAELLYIHDFNSAKCITEKVDDILKRFSYLVQDEVIIVKQEIESWYIAGLDENENNRLKMRNFRNTNDITKEVFNTNIPQRFDSRIDFMNEILKNYSIECAKNKNESFKYFVNKYLDN